MDSPTLSIVAHSPLGCAAASPGLSLARVVRLRRPIRLEVVEGPARRSVEIRTVDLYDCVECLRSDGEFEGRPRHSAELEEESTQGPRLSQIREKPRCSIQPKSVERAAMGCRRFGSRNAGLHSGLIKPFLCDECGLGFSQKSNLQRHLAEIHGGGEAEAFECERCAKVFRRKGNLDAHARMVHDKRKPFTCDLCRGSFCAKSALRTHMRECHLDSGGARCHLCGSLFSRLSSLDFHVATVHRGLKAFECDACGKRFSQNCRLQKHVQQVHRQIRGYECPVCGRKFSVKSNRDRHEREIHRGIRQRFDCSVCEKSFGHKCDLQAHTKFVHASDKCFACALCHKTFFKRTYLLRHQAACVSSLQVLSEEGVSR